MVSLNPFAWIKKATSPSGKKEKPRPRTQQDQINDLMSEFNERLQAYDPNSVRPVTDEALREKAARMES